MNTCVMCIYDTISLSSSRMENSSDKTCTENQNPHFVFNNSFSEKCTVYEVMWKNTIEPGRPHMTI